jgi:hypothetical protein
LESAFICPGLLFFLISVQCIIVRIYFLHNKALAKTGHGRKEMIRPSLGSNLPCSSGASVHVGTFGSSTPEAQGMIA